MKKQKTNREKTLFLAQFAILLAIEMIFCFTPLGSIPLGPGIVATLAMIPVILTAILLGTGAGTLMGLFSGIFSFLVWTFAPTGVTAFLFTPFYSIGEVHGNAWSLVICFIPRILTGTVTGLCYHGFSKLLRDKHYKNAIVYGLSGFLGSMVNTVLVLGGSILFFGEEMATALQLSEAGVLTLTGYTFLTNGIPEALLGMAAAWGICRPLQKMFFKRLK